MPLSARKSLTILAACLIAAPAFAGYEFPLQSPEIRDAYFLGQRPDNTPWEFLATYRHLFTKPQNDRDTITEIEVLTPYAQIVQRGIKNVPGDSAVQTETDVRAHPLPLLVKVTVVRSLVYPGDAGLIIHKDNGRDFSIELQQQQTLTPLQMTKWSFGGKHCPCGVEITTEFDPAKVNSAPLRIIVHTPEGQSLSTEFDLSKLK